MTLGEIKSPILITPPTTGVIDNLSTFFFGQGDIENEEPYVYNDNTGGSFSGGVYSLNYIDDYYIDTAYATESVGMWMYSEASVYTQSRTVFRRGSAWFLFTINTNRTLSIRMYREGSTSTGNSIGLTTTVAMPLNEWVYIASAGVKNGAIYVGWKTKTSEHKVSANWSSYNSWVTTNGTAYFECYDVKVNYLTFSQIGYPDIFEKMYVTNTGNNTYKATNGLLSVPTDTTQTSIIYHDESPPVGTDIIVSPLNL